MEASLSRRGLMHGVGSAVALSAAVSVAGFSGKVRAQDVGGSRGIASGVYVVYDESLSGAESVEIWSETGDPADVELVDETSAGICAGASDAYLDGVSVVVQHSGDGFGEALGLDSTGTLESIVVSNVIFRDELGDEILRIDGDLTLTITAG